MNKEFPRIFEKRFESAFLDHVKYDGLHVSFAEVDADGTVHRENGNIEGVVELALRYASIADFIKSAGGSVGQDLEVETGFLDVTLYVDSEDSAYVAVDCSATLRSDMSDREVRKAGIEAAESVNVAIKKIIDYSISKRNQAA